MEQTLSLYYQKRLFLELLCTPGDGKTLKERALQMGISEKRFNKWIRDEDLLRHAYNEYKKEIIPRLPKIFSALVEKAEEGDINAIKMVFQQLENFQGDSSGAGNLSTEDIIRIIREKRDES